MSTDAKRNSHYQPASSSYAWTSGLNQPVAQNPPRSRQESDFRRKTLQNFNTRSNKALGSAISSNTKNVLGDKNILPSQDNSLEHSPYLKDR